MFKGNANMEDLSYDELVQHANHFLKLSSDDFHDGANVVGSYNVMVAERFFNELKLRLILTAI